MGRFEEISRVIWIHLDSAATTATLGKAITQPQGLSAESQGNAQALGNGDTLVGSGALGRVSEFDPQGSLLLNAVIAGGDTYRAYRSPWAGQPDTRPTATAWTNADGTPTVHAIWNGATQVAAWRILAGSTAKRLTRVRTAPWNGLDTAVRIRGVPQEVQVVAIDAAGRVVGTSAHPRVD